MTVGPIPHRTPAAPDGLAPGTAPAIVLARFTSVPCPAAPPGTSYPGVLAAGADSTDGQVTRITRIALAAPGKPDGETDTRPLLPLWKQPSADPGAPERTAGHALQAEGRRPASTRQLPRYSWFIQHSCYQE